MNDLLCLLYAYWNSNITWYVLICDCLLYFVMYDDGNVNEFIGNSWEGRLCNDFFFNFKNFYFSEQVWCWRTWRQILTFDVDLDTTKILTQKLNLDRFQTKQTIWAFTTKKNWLSGLKLQSFDNIFKSSI